VLPNVNVNFLQNMLNLITYYAMSGAHELNMLGKR